MKIYFGELSTGAWRYLTIGMINALKDRGHTVERWDGNIETWNRFDPDLYIGSNGHKQNIPVDRRAKLVLQVSPWGSTYMPNISEKQETIDWTLNLKPDLVFGYGQEDEIEFWQDWVDAGMKWLSFPTAGDKTFFKQIVPLDQRVNDVVYLGGRWHYKGLTLDKYLIPILEDKNIKSVLKGWGDWPPGLCSGSPNDDEVNDFFNTGKIGPCVSEQHTLFYGIDIPERAWKVALSGLLIVHDNAFMLKKMIPSALISDGPKEFHDYIRYYLQPEHEQERIELVKKQQTEVLLSHTYHHRLANMFNALGLPDEANNMLSGV